MITFTVIGRSLRAVLVQDLQIFAYSKNQEEIKIRACFQSNEDAKTLESERKKHKLQGGR